MMSRLTSAGLLLAALGLPALFGDSPRRSEDGGHPVDFVARRADENETGKTDVRRTWDTEAPRRGRQRDDLESGTAVGERGQIIREDGYEVVLRDDEVVEIRRGEMGKRSFKLIKASALPDEELNKTELEYTLMELDRLGVRVEKQDTEVHDVRIKLNGDIDYPLIGTFRAKGLTEHELEVAMQRRFQDFIRDPQVHVEVKKKSPRARILVIGKGFREFEGHERILDVLGAGWTPTVENIYDKVTVIREQPDNSMRIILVDIEHMFKNYDFTQNIPLKAGDIIHVRKIPPLFGYRFKWWWSQILGWMNEVDEAFNAYKSITNFDPNE